MGALASQITSLTIVYSVVYSGANQRKHQSSASLAFVRGIHRWPVNSPHKGPVTRKRFHSMTSSWYDCIWLRAVFSRLIVKINLIKKTLWRQLFSIVIFFMLVIVLKNARFVSFHHCALNNFRLCCMLAGSWWLSGQAIPWYSDNKALWHLTLTKNYENVWVSGQFDDSEEIQL